MRLDDLLQVMRDEFAQAADLIDGHVMAWLGEPARAPHHADAVAAELDRVATTARVISLEGLALALEQVRDGASALALLDDETMGLGLGWLAGWRAPFESCFGAPGAEAPAHALLAWLGGSPLTPDAPLLAALRERLVLPPALPDDGSPADLPLDAATEDDVSLDVPEDVARDLCDTFLADSPAQVARLGDLVRALVADGLPEQRLQEAQRVAHTFKGSGNIIGIRGVGRLAHRIEDLIEFAGAHGGRLPAPMAHDLEQACATLDQMVYALRGEEEPPVDARARLQALLDWVAAIRDDRWQALVEERTRVATTTTAATTTAPSSPDAAPRRAAAPAAADGDTEAQLRVGVSRLDRLVRRAGMGLVHGGRLDEQMRQMDDRLQALADSQRNLQQRLAELQTALERQGVSLREQAASQGEAFDPLELDRYNQLHTLSRFVAELADDGGELLRNTRGELAGAGATLREHLQALKDQHHELLGARLLPLQHVVPRLRRTVSQTAATLGRRVDLVVEGEHVALDSAVLERLTEPLLHLLRNAVDHGIEPPDERLLLGKPEHGTIRLAARRDGHSVQVSVHDDGRGIDLGAVEAKARGLGLVGDGESPDDETLLRLILLPGFSTRDEVTEVSGRGVGMDVVAERLRSMKGRIEIASEPLLGTRFELRVPATTGSMHALVVQAGGDQFALPTDSVLRAVAAGSGELRDGRFALGDDQWPCARLADWLGLPDSGAADGLRPVVLVRAARGTVALQVDRVLDARSLVLQDLGTLLRRVRGAAAGALRPDGRPLFVLDPEALEPVGSRLDDGVRAALRRRATVKRQRVMVVDDALSVRKALLQLLGDAGYETDAARDGFEALQRLGGQRCDLLLTDLEMPNLNGLDLVRHLRQQAAWKALPVVMITSRTTDKHRDAALTAGVDLYLTKPYTDGELLGHVRALLAR